MSRIWTSMTTNHALCFLDSDPRRLGFLSWMAGRMYRNTGPDLPWLSNPTEIPMPSVLARKKRDASWWWMVEKQEQSIRTFLLPGTAEMANGSPISERRRRSGSPLWMEKSSVLKWMISGVRTGALPATANIFLWPAESRTIGCLSSTDKGGGHLTYSVRYLSRPTANIMPTRELRQKPVSKSRKSQDPSSGTGNQS